MSLNPMEALEKNKALTERQPPTKKQRNLATRQQREKERLRHHRRQKLKKVVWVAAAALIIGVVIWGGGLCLANRPPQPTSAVISTQGIHWHAELSITISGQKHNIPANVGLGIVTQPIHTHEEDNILHLEFADSVRKDDIRLNRFFTIWGREFNQDCIFDSCNGPEGRVNMLVNREPNFEFENYIMRDEDKIEIIFEK